MTNKQCIEETIFVACGGSLYTRSTVVISLWYLELFEVDMNHYWELADAPHLWPPASTVVPPKPVTSLPPGENCGQVIVTKERGTFRFPGYPTHRRQGNCNYVIEAPKGYDLVIKFPNFPLSSRYVYLISVGLVQYIIADVHKHNTNHARDSMWITQRFDL